MKLLSVSTLLACAALTCGNAQAQSLQMSPYLGASVGGSSWNADCSGTTSCNKTPTTFRLFGGYFFQPNVGIELTAASLGTVKASGANFTTNTSAASYDVSAVYRFGSNNSRFGAFVKGGLAYTRSKASATVGTTNGSDVTNGFGLLVGAGVTYALGDYFSLRAELDTQKVKVPGSSGNVTSFTVGGQGAF